VNDQLGHSAGDDLMARAGEVLRESVGTRGYAARIGGDEFAVILPGHDEVQGGAVVDDIRRLVELNNTFHGEPGLMFSIGMGTSQGRESLENVMKRADQQMYEAKRRRYSQGEFDRRRGISPGQA
jgi:diguanylate cyclase (GGDEF)-like protein